MRNKEKKMGIKEKVLEKLIETDDYISGEDMAEQLGVTRAAVWKAIKSLTEEDELNIEAVRKVGYRLLDNNRKLLSRTLDSDKIAEYLANDDNFTLARINRFDKPRGAPSRVGNDGICAESRKIARYADCRDRADGGSRASRKALLLAEGLRALYVTASPPDRERRGIDLHNDRRCCRCRACDRQIDRSESDDKMGK